MTSEPQPEKMRPRVTARSACLGASLELATLPATLDVPVIRQAVEVLMRISQSELERQRYLERQRAEQDAASLAEDARVAHQVGFDEGLEQGIEKGIEQGIEKGIQIGRIKLLQQLLEQPETSNEELSRLPEQQLGQLEESLKQQLRGKRLPNGPPPPDRT